MNRSAIIGIVLCCLSGGIPVGGYAQPMPLKAVFTGAITLDSLTHYMNMHTDIRLTFNSGKIKGGRTVVFPGRPLDLNGLLVHIQQHTGLSYAFYGKHVIFRDDPRKAMNVVRKGPVQKRDKLPQPEKTTTLRSVRIRVGLAKTDTVKRNAVVIGTRVKRTGVAVVKRNLLNRVDPSGRVDAPGRRENDVPPPASGWILRAGVFANEVFYANAGIEAGFKPAFLLFSVGSNFHVTSWHIGAGAVAFKLWGWNSHITVGYSPLKTTIGIDSGSSKIDFTVKGQWYDLGLAACKQYGKHWLFRAGVSFNLLKTSYNRNGVAVSPGRWLSQEQDGDKLLYLLRPPVKIVNTYDRNASTNIKIWPGLSLGWYYSIF